MYKLAHQPCRVRISKNSDLVPYYQNTVPSKRIWIGGEASFLNDLAKSRPACHVPPSRTCDRGNSSGDNFIFLRNSSATKSMRITVNARHSTISSVPTFNSC